MSMQSPPPPFPGGPSTPAFTPPPAAQRPGQPPKGKEDDKPTRKVVSKNRTFAIVLAVVAVLIAFLTMSSSGGPKAFVLRAKTDITAMSPITEGDVEAVGVENEALIERGALRGATRDEVMTAAKEKLVGKRSILPISMGAQLKPDQISLEDKVTQDLAPNERLMSVSASLATATAGGLQIGDRVDVIATNGECGAVVYSDAPIAAVQLPAQALEQLAQGQATPSGDSTEPAADRGLPANPIPGTYVLRVKADSVLALAVADQGAELYLVFRGSKAADAISSSSKVSIGDVIGSTQDATCDPNLRRAMSQNSNSSSSSGSTGTTGTTGTTSGR